MKISVIIVSYNTDTILEKCLENLFQFSGNNTLDVFVVDNDSYDNSVDMVKRNFKEIHLIENKVNRGFAAANNQAYKKADGHYIILLNPDAYIKPGTIDNAVTFMENHPECGLAGGRLINLEGKLDPSARRFPNSLNKFFTLSGLADKYPLSGIFGKGDFKFFDHNSVIEVDWVPGTFTIYRPEMLQQLNNADSLSVSMQIPSKHTSHTDHSFPAAHTSPAANTSGTDSSHNPPHPPYLFDERFYIYYEETDLCLQAKRLGWKIFFLPNAEVIHVGGASAETRKDLTFDRGGSQVLKFRMRSEYLYFRKNYGLLSVIANAGVELSWHLLRYFVNSMRNKRNDIKRRKASESFAILKHGITALLDTRFGSKAPDIPW